MLNGRKENIISNVSKNVFIDLLAETQRRFIDVFIDIYIKFRDDLINQLHGFAEDLVDTLLGIGFTRIRYGLNSRVISLSRFSLNTRRQLTLQYIKSIIDDGFKQLDEEIMELHSMSSKKTRFKHMLHEAFDKYLGKDMENYMFNKFNEVMDMSKNIDLTLSTLNNIKHKGIISILILIIPLHNIYYVIIFQNRFHKR